MLFQSLGKIDSPNGTESIKFSDIAISVLGTLYRKPNNPILFLAFCHVNCLIPLVLRELLGSVPRQIESNDVSTKEFDRFELGASKGVASDNVIDS